MVNVAIAGAQWGDEGKGKVVDILAGHFDYVIRYQGGHNAGHSVVFDGERFALHVLPSGIFHPKTVNLIANGVVVEPFQLVKEIVGMRERGIEVTPQNLRISDRAHLIMPYHGIIDRFREGSGNERKIGTTGRGIGPAYEWKASRRGIRFCDIKHRDYMIGLIENDLTVINRRYGEVPELRDLKAGEMMTHLDEALTVLAPHVVDGVALLAEARAKQATLLFEGAQATLLDVDFGTYPYVTSSNSCATGICAGAGVPPATVDQVIGIFKAYSTRVGEGPFPTELDDAVGEDIRKAGMEFGTTTGRPRRCGWLDLVALKYACRINGYHTLAMMKLDVLDELSELKVCTSYTIDGVETTDFPASLVDLQRATPNYRTFPGWQQSLAQTTDPDALPEAARAYIDFIESYTGCGIGLVSVGPDRVQTIMRDARFFK